MHIACMYRARRGARSPHPMQRRRAGGNEMWQQEGTSQLLVQLPCKQRVAQLGDAVLAPRVVALAGGEGVKAAWQARAACRFGMLDGPGAIHSELPERVCMCGGRWQGCRASRAGTHHGACIP